MHPISILGLAAALVAAPPVHHMAPNAAPAAARLLVVTARNYAYDIPDTVAAGRTQIHLVNAGSEMHHATLLRLKGGHTFAEFVAASKDPGPPSAWVQDIGGPNTPAPGGTSDIVLDLTPGTYVATCFIPSPDGQPHFMKGMTRAFTVVPASQMRAAVRTSRPSNGPSTGMMTSVAAPDVTMDLADYSFALSRPLAPGRHVIRVTNGAQQSHEVFFVRLAPGKTAADVAAYVEKMAGPPPGEPLGGTASMAAGATNDVVLDLTPGRYAMLCFVPDARDGKPHVAHGMLKDFVVQ